MSDALPLPPRPNLEQYKKLVKDFQHACKSDDPDAIRQWAARLGETMIRSEIDREAERIEHRWREFKKTNERAARCMLTGVQLFMAREHGFASWPKFAKHVEAMAHASSAASKFEAAVDAIVSGDLAGLKKLLSVTPDLAQARSTREHRSTLLHYVSANGVEDFRQKTPKNIIEITKMLIDAGADVNAESDAYGGGSTTLGLVATSLHPQRAGVQIALLQTLLDHGAWIERPSSGKWQSAIRACLANGQPEAAEFLASKGAPLDLETAAGVGALGAVKSHFDENGTLKTPAAKRQMESGFLYACGYGRKAVVEFLLERGMDPGFHGDGGRTGLHAAAHNAQVDVVKLLLERGAPVDAKDESYQATPLDVALWIWDTAPDKAERCYQVIALLARAGAKLDPRQWSNSDEDDSGMFGKIRSDPRMQAALRGETLGA
jgi:ankyrin repeat protein